MHKLKEIAGQSMIIRADANANIGTGHVMRCLALAQFWSDLGGRVIFITALEEPKLLERLRVENIDIMQLKGVPGSTDDAKEVATTANKCDASWIVHDGAQFDDKYQLTVKNNSRYLLSIDDAGHSSHYYADIVLNQNLFAREDMYAHRESYTRLLLGTDYVLLRREFLNQGKQKRDISEKARNILVTLGGADQKNHTLKILKALREINILDSHITIVIGASNPNAVKIEEEVRSSHLDANIVRDVKDMSEYMKQADLAVSTGGTTVWELAYMGVPTIVGINTAYEETLVNSLAAHGLCIDIGWLDSIRISDLAETLKKVVDNRCLRINIRDACQKLVIGHGTRNVIREMINRNGGTIARTLN